MTTYPFRLSNGQRKRYLIRRGLLRIAVPLPLDWPDDATVDLLRQFVLTSLHRDLIEPHQLRSISESEIAVVPGGNHPLGKIIGDIAAQSTPHIVVVVAIAEISVDEAPRHPTAPLQWPGDCSLVWPYAVKSEHQ